VESVPELGVTGQLRLEHLDRDLAVQPGVVGLPHLAHPADGDAPAQPVPLRQQLPAAQPHEATTEGIVRCGPAVAEFDNSAVPTRHNSRGVELGDSTAGDSTAASLLVISGFLARRRR
jgi:hypothetical protein